MQRFPNDKLGVDYSWTSNLIQINLTTTSPQFHWLYAHDIITISQSIPINPSENHIESHGHAMKLRLNPTKSSSEFGRTTHHKAIHGIVVRSKDRIKSVNGMTGNATELHDMLFSMKDILYVCVYVYSYPIYNKVGKNALSWFVMDCSG